MSTELISTPHSGRPKLALVTGAAHRVGRLLALELAGLGYDIALHYHHAAEDVVAGAVDAIQARGRNAYPLQADLGQPAEIEQLFAAIQHLPAELRIVVNSAALMPALTIAQSSLEDWQAVMDLNLRAPWYCTRAAANIMEPGGLVIHICDEFAGQTWKRYALYGLSKYTLEHLTRMQAGEYQGRMRVNGLALGPVLPPAEMPDGMWDRVVKRSALGQATSSTLIGQALAYLIENEYISGEIIRPGSFPSGQEPGSAQK